MSVQASCPCGWTRTYTSAKRAERGAEAHTCLPRESTRRCRTCGWKGTYPSARKADYAKRRHSCERQLHLADRKQRHADRMASIDRTPKPCRHKRADHQHGTNACYVLDRCRCAPCCAARRVTDDTRRRQQAYGRYNRYVDADPVRAHIADLSDYGIGLKTVARLAGVSQGSLSKIVYGVYAPGPGGRNGKGERLRGPSARVLRTTADRILTVQAVPENLGPREPDHERHPTTLAHLRALVALGWSISELGRRIDVAEGNAAKLAAGHRTLARGTVDKIEQLYADLSMTLPPADTPQQRAVATRARKHAADHGWPPPLDLEDVDNRDQDYVDVDEVAVQRRLAGDRTVPLNRAEKAAVARAWQATGRSASEGERVTGVRMAFRRDGAA